MKEKLKKIKEKIKKNKIVAILLLIIFICVVVITVLLVKNKLTDDGTLNAVRLSYSTKVKVSLDKKKVQLSFRNPSVSNQNMVLTVQILDGNKEIEIAKSQSVPVGYLIKELDLNKKVSLKKGKYKGQFVINYYKEKTNEKSMLDTKTPITIEVN